LKSAGTQNHLEDQLVYQAEMADLQSKLDCLDQFNDINTHSELDEHDLHFERSLEFLHYSMASHIVDSLIT
jgi:hypothetical protein